MTGKIGFICADRGSPGLPWDLTECPRRGHERAAESEHLRNLLHTIDIRRLPDCQFPGQGWDRLWEGSLYRLLADNGPAMFPDDYFADLYTAPVEGQPTVPACVVATVMVLQAFEGLSDREACDRLEADLRWQAAAGVDVGYRAFHPTLFGGGAEPASRVGPLGPAVRGHLHSGLRTALYHLPARKCRCSPTRMSRDCGSRS